MNEDRIVELLMTIDSKLNNALAKLENHEKEINELRDHSIKRIHERLDNVEHDLAARHEDAHRKRDQWIDYVYKTIVGVILTGIVALLARAVLNGV